MPDILMQLLIGIPLLYFVFMYLWGPILVKRNEQQPGCYMFTKLDERQFFSQRSDTFIMLDFDMRNLGFTYVGSSVLGNTNTDSYFSLYTKTDEALSAMLTTMESPLGDFTYLEFSRRYEDGSSLEVSNAPLSPLFPRHPMKLQLRYPQLNTLRELYAVMQKLLEADLNSAAPLALTAGRGFRELEAILNGELGRLVKHGYYASSVVDGYRAITWKGALCFSWKSLWPWQQFRQLIDRWRSNRVLRRT